MIALSAITGILGKAWGWFTDKTTSWLTVGFAYWAGRKSVGSEINEKIVDIKVKQNKIAANRPDDDSISGGLRNDKETW